MPYPPRGLQPFEFQQRVSKSYDWSEAKIAFENKANRGRFIMATSTWEKTTKPLEEDSGLFHVLAKLECSESAILGFVRVHGLLGGNISKAIVPDGSTTVGVGERLEDWAAEIGELRDLIQLWEFVQSGSIRELAKIIKWSENGVRAEWLKSDGAFRRGTVIAHPGINPELLQRFIPKDVVQPAQYCVQRLINDKLTKHTSRARLLWNGKRPRTPDLEVFIVPEGLIAAIWLQFANAVAGDKQYRVCEGCGRWFEYGEGTGKGSMRSDARACSTTCRGRIFRSDRKKKAEGNTNAKKR